MVGRHRRRRALGRLTADHYLRHDGAQGPILCDPGGPVPRVYFLTPLRTADRWHETGSLALGTCCYVALTGTLTSDTLGVHWITPPLCRRPEPSDTPAPRDPAYDPGALTFDATASQGCLRHIALLLTGTAHALADVVLAEAVRRLSGPLEGTARCAQGHARLVRALLRAPGPPRQPPRPPRPPETTAHPDETRLPGARCTAPCPTQSGPGEHYSTPRGAPP